MLSFIPWKPAWDHCLGYRKTLGIPILFQLFQFESSAVVAILSSEKVSRNSYVNFLMCDKVYMTLQVFLP